MRAPLLRAIALVLLAIPAVGGAAVPRARGAAAGDSASVRRDSARASRDTARMNGLVADIDAPPVVPGAIATMSVSVPIPVPGRASQATYRVRAYDGVRVFGDTVGTLRGSGETVLLPITYSVARSRVAGTMPIVRVTVTWSDGSSWTADVQAQVQARYALRATATVESMERTSALVRYALTNIGNTADTVLLRWDAGWGWQVDPPTARVVVDAGRTLEGAVRVSWSLNARAGELHVVDLMATGMGSTATTTVTIRVPYPSEDALGLVRAASTLFVGSAVDAAGNAVALARVDATSAVTPLTTVELHATHGSGASAAQVVGSALADRRFSLVVRRPTLSTTMGNVFRTTTGIIGTVAQGNGLDVEWSPAKAVQAAFVFAQAASGSHVHPGSTMFASADVRRWGGTLGAFAGGFTSEPPRDAAVTPGESDSSRVVTTGLRYRLGDGHSQTFSAELGAMQVRAGTEQRTGLALDANYAADFSALNLYGRLHRLPGTESSGQLLPDQALVGGAYRLTTTVSALASAGVSETRPVNDVASGTRSVSGGFAFAPEYLNAQLTGTAYTSTSPRQTVRPSGRSVGASLSVPAGSFAFDGSAQVGSISIGDTMTAISQLRAGARWSGSAGWGWLGASYLDGYGGASVLQLDATGSYNWRATTIELGASATPGAARSAGLPVNDTWARVSVPTHLGYAVTAGAQYTPAATGAWRWRMSLGVRTQLDVPLPFRQSPVVAGTVFDDENGNGVMDPDEHGVAGVVVNAGDQHRQTGANGQFSFLDPSTRDAAVSVDAASLPDGYMAPPTGRALTAHGRIAVPVVRAATLVLLMHTEGTDDSASLRESPIEAPDGTGVSVRDARGRERIADVTNGMARVDALAPGHYTVTVIVPATSWRDVVERTFEIEVAAGQRERRDILVPSARRTIRFGPTPEAQSAPAADSGAAASLPATDSAACGTACSDSRSASATSRAASLPSAPSSRKASSTRTSPPRSPRAMTIVPPSAVHRPLSSRTRSRARSEASSPAVASRPSRPSRMTAKRTLAPTTSACVTTGAPCPAPRAVTGARRVRMWATAGIRTAVVMGWLP